MKVWHMQSGVCQGILLALYNFCDKRLSMINSNLKWGLDWPRPMETEVARSNQNVSGLTFTKFEIEAILYLHHITSIEHFCTVSHCKRINLYIYSVQIQIFDYRIITTRASCLNIDVIFRQQLASTTLDRQKWLRANVWLTTITTCDIMSVTLHERQYVSKHWQFGRSFNSMSRLMSKKTSVVLITNVLLGLTTVYPKK